ncbi:hypothetical protein AN1V17_35980 [Vallitalea sediminicola]
MRTLKVIFTIITLILVLCSCESLKNETNNQINPPQESHPTDSQQSENISKETNINSIPVSTNNDLVKLLIVDKLELSDDFIRLFFDYYNMHLYELAELPQFNSSSQPDWDQLTLYTYLNFINESQNYIAEFSKEDFKKTINKYWGEMKYTDKESSYLEYSNSTYICKPGDTMRSGYYRLTNISKDEAGLYTATFDGLFFGEVEIVDEYELASSNIKAIRDAAGTKDYMQGNEFKETILSIFLKENYNEILDMTEKVTIQFILTDDNVLPFMYKSCKIISY